MSYKALAYVTQRNNLLLFPLWKGVKISEQTIRNRLHEGGPRARRAWVGPVLTDWHWGPRLAFAVELAGPSLALCAYEHYTACNISLHSQFGGRSVKVCGGVAVHPSMDISPNNNALPHVAMVCRQFLKDKGIDTTEKPPTLAWHKSNRSPRGHYILVHLIPPGCTSDVPGAQWCPDVGGDLPAHHPSSH